MDYPPRQASRSGCSTTAAPTRSATRTIRKRPRRRASDASSCRRWRAELGAHYLTRARNEHAKAGNMNNGLSFSTGELIVVFDADHVPVREFLRETVGYFRAGPAIVPRARPRISSPIPTRSSAISTPSRRCRRRTRCSTASSRTASTNGTAPSSAARPRCVRRAALERGRRLFRHHHHRGLRDRARSAFPRLEQLLRRRADDLGPAARDLRVLHRPALALGARHVPDLPAEEPGAQARPQRRAEDLLPLQHDLSGSSRSSACRSWSHPCCSSSSTCKSTSPTSRNSSPTRSLYMIGNMMMQNYLYGARALAAGVRGL